MSLPCGHAAAAGNWCARCCADELSGCVAEALVHDALGYWKNGGYTKGMRARFQQAVDRMICPYDFCERHA